MDDDASSDLQKCLSESPMDADEGPLINENSNGLSHLLTENEFNSVDAVVVDESSVSNQAFLNAVELSGGSVGDYLDNNAEGFNTDSFDVGDNAVTFPSDSMNNVLSDGDSRLSDVGYKVVSDNDGDVSNKLDTDFGNVAGDLSSDVGLMMPNEAIIDNEASNDVTEVTAEVNEADEVQPVAQENNASNSKNTEVPQKESKSVDDSDLQKEIIEPDIVMLDLQAESKNIDESDNQVPQKESKSIDDSETTNDSVFKDGLETKDIVEPEGAKDSKAKEDSPPKEKMNMQDSEATNDSVIEEPEIAKDSKAKGDSPLKETVNMQDSKATNDSVSKDDLKAENKVGGAEETEVVSEDELPTVEKPSVKDAENVSDDELPGPKPADLPADTEVVSEDELPTSKKDSKENRKRKNEDDKDGYDPGSPTTEAESANKKQAVAKNGESKPISSEKRPSTDEKPKKKVLPELDKYWKVVNDDPTDFTGWTYLLQYVDQESDVEAAREAYDAFLSHYPYCYGYWRKYADYEKRKGSKKKCLEVLERGLKAIPLSVDLWIHYLNHIKTTRTEDHTFIRLQYERAIEACGLEFRSDRLWESYIKWEAENGSALNVTNIYDRLLATPTLGYTSHFDNFQEHVMGEPVTGVVSKSELVRLRGEVRETSGTQPQLDLPPGEDEPQDHVASEEEAQAIKERIIAARRKVHKTTGEEVAARWAFEEGIKRPYFHVKPLERCQLKNWKLYLEWEKQHGSLKRALVLHERCLIACALYEEFWMRLIKFLEERSESHPELVAVEREVLERACTVHHLDKPELHLHWAHFEEAQGNTARAADILDRIEKTCPNLVQIQYRRVNLERRRGDLDKCAQLYEGYIAAAKNKAVASALAVKYARFQFHVRQDSVAARKALDEAIAKDPLNPRLHMQRLDIALHTPGTPYEELEELVSAYEKQEGADTETSARFAWRRRELAEELGSAAAARAAQHHARALAKHLRKRARALRTAGAGASAADPSGAPPPHPHQTNVSSDSSKKKDGTNSSTALVAAGANANAYYQPAGGAGAGAGGAGGAPYEQSYAQPYQPPWGYQQPPAPYAHHPNPWPQYPNYY